MTAVAIGHAEMELVRRAANRMLKRLPSSVRFDDLYSAGAEALAAAARRFDPSRGVPFAVYAERRVTGAMLDDLRAGDTVSKDRRRAIREGRESPDALPAPRLVAEEAAAAVPAGGLGPEEALERRRREALLHAAIEALPPRLREVQRLRFDEELKLGEIAGLFGVTEARACQLVAEVVKRLRAAVMEEPESCLVSPPQMRRENKASAADPSVAPACAPVAAPPVGTEPDAEERRRRGPDRHRANGRPRTRPLSVAGLATHAHNHYEVVKLSIWCTRCEVRQKLEGKSRCWKCLKWQRERSVARAAELAAKGLCPQCRQPSSGGWRCDDCKAKRRRARAGYQVETATEVAA